jgi:two-component system LytT family response regulator
VTIYRRTRGKRASEGDRLVVQTGTGERLLDFAEIEYLEASRNYVSVFTEEREYLLRETLASLESRLARHGFLRTHRSYLVNRARVAGVEPGAGAGQHIVLKSGRKVPLSRSRRGEVRAALGLDAA